MKKLMSLLVAVALVAFMASCGGGEEAAADQGAQQVEQAVEQEAPAQEEPAQEEATQEEGAQEEATQEGTEE